MKTYINFSLTLLITLVSCSKEPDVLPTPAATSPLSDEAPTITLTQPTENFTVDLGQSFSIEGVAYDKESLASVNYSIQTPSASYNYTLSNSISASGTSHNFNEPISIPSSASVGDAVLTIYSKDTDNNQSTNVVRNFRIIDKIDPVVTILKDSVGALDLIKVKVYKNSNNVVDSVILFNQTKSENIATVKDIGGFKTIVCTVTQDGFLGAPANSKTQYFDLVGNFQNSYDYQLNEPTCSGPCNLYSLVIGFREYDNTFNNSTTTISEGYAKFEFIY